MTARLLATAEWRALDREGEDTCRLSRTGDGWLLVGHARFRDELGFAALDYVVRCNEAWETLSADVAGTHDTRKVKVRLHRDGDRWWRNNEPRTSVTGAFDVDLSFTPATNLMPLRRLMASQDRVQDVTAAWLRYPETRLVPLDQAYGRTDMTDVFSYTAQQTDFSTLLSVDRSGFVTLYPGLWEGEVTYAD